MNIFQNKILLIPILLFACQASPPNKNEKSITLIVKDSMTCENKSKELESNKLKSEISLLFESIDINKLKKEYGKNSTSGKVNTKQNFHYNKSNEDSFLGAYFFPNEKEEDEYPIDLKLIIESNAKIWSFSDKDEKLVELVSYSKQINILPINVSDSISLVRNYFSTPLKKLDTDIFYISDSEGTIISLKVKDSIIDKIRIGRYKFSNIEEINEILISTFKY